MDYRYISEVMEGARRLLRMLPDSVRKTEYRRMAVAPGVDARPPVGIPDTLADGASRRVLAVDRMAHNGRKIATSDWKAVLHSTTRLMRAAGDPPPAPPVKDRSDAYPAGMPIRPDDIQHARNYRPRSIDGGEYLCWRPPPRPCRLRKSGVILPTWETRSY